MAEYRQISPELQQELLMETLSKHEVNIWKTAFFIKILLKAICKRLQLILQNLDKIVGHPLWHMLNMQWMSVQNFSKTVRQRKPFVKLVNKVSVKHSKHFPNRNY